MFTHHEEAIDDALLMRHDRPVFVSKSLDGSWTCSTNLPRGNLWYTVCASGEVFLNCPDAPKPIRIRGDSAKLHKKSEGG